MQAVCCLPYDFCLFANQFVHLQGQSWVCCYFCVWKRCWTRQVTKFGFEHRYSSASDTETRVPLLIRSPHLQNTNTSTARVWHIRHTKKGPNAISEISHSPFHTQPLPGPKAQPKPQSVLLLPPQHLRLLPGLCTHFRLVRAQAGKKNMHPAR